MDHRLGAQPGVGSMANTPGNADPGSLGRANVGWSAMAVVGRQVSQLAAALVLARLLGPESFGVISAATVYVTLTTLILDQGLAAALVQQPGLGARTVGAVVSANLVMGVVLACGTWFLAPGVAAFFGDDRLTDLIRILGLGLLVKAVAITPRALQLRQLGFKTLAAVDVTAGVLGAACGIVAAFVGAGTWALAWQVIATDVLVAALLLATARTGRPNLDVGALRAVLPFSLRVFGSNSLAFFARNSDNILVGRYLGMTSLSLYSMAYRVLVIPVQLIGQTVNRVAFPTLSRLIGRPDEVAATTRRMSELLATLAVPPMVLVAVSARDLVHVVLGAEWLAAAPILAVLAVAGARETALQGVQSLMRACGKGRMILRYEVAATAVQVSGIVAGLQFGVMGVAVGFTVAGFVLTPALLLIQRRLAGVTVREQGLAMWPAVHCSLWGALGYLVVGTLGMAELPTLVMGVTLFVLVAGSVLAWLHRPTWRRVVTGDRMRLGRAS